MTNSGSTRFFPNLNSRRTWLVALGAAVLAIGGALNWNWIIAAGVAPFVLSVLPCVVMCSLGLCMVGMANRRASAQQSPDSSSPASSSGLDCCAPRPAAGQLPSDVLQR